MRSSRALLCVAVVGLAGCASGGGGGGAAAAGGVRFPAETEAELRNVRPDGKIEFALKDDGSLGQVEFHVPPSTLPKHILEAMDRLVPGGETIDAEIEYADGRRLYEVTKRVGNLEREALFDDAGNVVEWEVEVERGEVPDSIVQTAAAAAPGEFTAYEAIKGPDEVVRAWHMKKNDGGIKYKIAVGADGALIVVVRETNAEIEVPVRPRR